MAGVNGKMIATNKREVATVSKGSEAVKNYYNNFCVEWKIRAVKAEGEAIKAYATDCGCSVQSLFLAAVKDYMDRGLVPDAVKRGRKKKEENK